MTDIVERLRNVQKDWDPRLTILSGAAGEIERLRAERDELLAVLHQIQSWSEAYPLTVFPKPDYEKARQLLEAGGMTLDRISADCMRHVVEGVGEIARAAIAKADRPNKAG
jgi:hypothetical protein